MIDLYHGSNQAESRKKLLKRVAQAKLSEKEVVWINGKTVEPNQLIQALESSSLFGSDRLVVVENLVTRPKSKTKDKLKQILKNNAKANLIVWEEKKVDGRKLRAYPFNNVDESKAPKIIFKLLDSLSPKKPQQILKLYHQTLNSADAQMIFYMLVWRWRDLLIAKTAPKQVKGASWQKARLFSQAKRFKLKKLLFIYSRLLKIDRNLKTGQSPHDLESELDFLIADL